MADLGEEARAMTYRREGAKAGTGARLYSPADRLRLLVPGSGLSIRDAVRPESKKGKANNSTSPFPYTSGKRLSARRILRPRFQYVSQFLVGITAKDYFSL